MGSGVGDSSGKVAVTMMMMMIVIIIIVGGVWVCREREREREVEQGAILILNEGVEEENEEMKSAQHHLHSSFISIGGGRFWT